MELLIRSQDKISLVPITGAIGLKYNDNTQIIANYIPDFTDNYEDGYYDELGKYETRKRALEVLDEIQNKIAQNQILISLMQNFTDLKDHEEDISRLFKDMIYEMPEK